jgi:hypothetical protein
VLGEGAASRVIWGAGLGKGGFGRLRTWKLVAGETVAYYGTADGDASALKQLAVGLDTASVRIVAARPGIASVRAALEACRPAAVL